MVISNTVVSFDGAKTEFTLPDRIDVDPSLLLDEHNEVYRLSIGNVNLSPDKAAEYEPFFYALNHQMKRDNFIFNMRFIVGDCILVFKLAYVEKIKTPHGTIYEIEAALDEVALNGKDL